MRRPLSMTSLKRTFVSIVWTTIPGRKSPYVSAPGFGRRQPTQSGFEILGGLVLFTDFFHTPTDLL